MVPIGGTTRCELLADAPLEDYNGCGVYAQISSAVGYVLKDGRFDGGTA